MIPVFIKGNIRFRIDAGGRERDLEFLNRHMSVWGVNALPWGAMSPELHFGRTIEIDVEAVSASQPLRFRTEASITREATRVGQHMGLRFRLSAQNAEALNALIRKEGFLPTEYLRKYPRIPSLPMIQTFPLRALILGEGAATALPITLDVENLSPNGVLLSSENQQTLSIAPGVLVNLVLEPRGWFPMPISAQGLVCRIGDELNPRTGNMTRTLGIKFTRIDEANRAAFVDLLKDILERFKNIEK